MNFFIGVDGGATKTKAIVGDSFGNILGKGESSSSNYHFIGLENSLKSINLAIDTALDEASLSINDIAEAVFGLSGADLPAHFQELEAGITRIFPKLRFHIVNDTWIALKSGSRKGWGVAIVCGTGANACVCSPEGNWFTLRGLGYETGLASGAMNMVRDVLHYAFRSHDGIGPKTQLEDLVLKATNLFDYNTLSELVFEFFFIPSFTKPELIQLLNVIPSLFQLAAEGDEVSIKILSNHGQILGDIAGWLIKKMNLEELETEVVLSGRIFHSKNSPLTHQLKETLKKMAPKTLIIHPTSDPVIGAYIMALEKTNCKTDNIVNKLIGNYGG